MCSVEGLRYQARRSPRIHIRCLCVISHFSSTLAPSMDHYLSKMYSRLSNPNPKMRLKKRGLKITQMYILRPMSILYKARKTGGPHSPVTSLHLPAARYSQSNHEEGEGKRGEHNAGVSGIANRTAYEQMVIIQKLFRHTSSQTNSNDQLFLLKLTNLLLQK